MSDKTPATPEQENQPAADSPAPLGQGGGENDQKIPKASGKLTEFDSVGDPKDIVKNTVLDNPELKKIMPKEVGSPRRFLIGCGGFVLFVYLILIVVMVIGLTSGAESIRNIGLDPTSFKNWSIWFINVSFGAFALTALILLVSNIFRRLLATKGEVIKRKQSVRKIIIYIILMLVVVTAWVVTDRLIRGFDEQEALIAEIVTLPASPLGLTSPVTVSFDADRIKKDLSNRYIIVNYLWDRESDGQVDERGEKIDLDFIDKGKNDGVYKVTLTVKLQPLGDNNEGIVEEKIYKKTVSIAKQNMYGEIEAKPASGKAPLTTSLDASKIIDPDGARIINYQWYFDDGEKPAFDSPDSRRVEHIFTAFGEHTVRLIVTSDDWAQDGVHEEKTFEKIITVFRPNDIKAEAVIVATPKVGVTPLKITLDAMQSASTKHVDKFEWIINDGADKLYGGKVSYTFTEPGIYSVKLNLTYATGQSATDNVEIRVSDPRFAPEAVIRTDPGVSTKYRAVAGPAPFTVIFDGVDSKDSDNNIVKYEWDFNTYDLENISEEGSRVTHTYIEPGKYRVRLTVIDRDELASESYVDIFVDEEVPVVDFGAPTLSAPAPLTVDFDASASRLPGHQIISYEWDFDTDNRSRSKQPFIYERAQTSHIFEEVREYTVKLTIHGDDGSKESNTIKIIPTYQSLKSMFTASRLSGPAPLAITFDGSTSEGSISRGEWDFGDGTTSIEQKPVHIFESAGTYTVTLRIYDDQGNVDAYSQTVKVLGN